MNKKILIGIFVCLLFSIAFYFYLETKNEDYFFHYRKTRNECDQIINPDCPAYPWLYHSIAGFFSGGEEQPFKIFNIFFIAILFPLLLYWFSQNIWIMWFYFSAINFPFLVLFYGHYPMVLAMAFWLVFLKINNTPLRIFLILSSLIVHNTLIWLLVVSWFFLKTEGFFKSKLNHLFRMFSSGSGMLLVMNPSYAFSITVAKIDFFLRAVFPAFGLIGFVDLLKKQRIAFVLIILFSFVVWLGQTSWTFIPIQLLLLIGFSGFFVERKNSEKLCLLAVSGFFLLFNFFDWGILR